MAYIRTVAVHVHLKEPDPNALWVDATSNHVLNLKCATYYLTVTSWMNDGSQLIIYINYQHPRTDDELEDDIKTAVSSIKDLCNTEEVLGFQLPSHPQYIRYQLTMVSSSLFLPNDLSLPNFNAPIMYTG